METERLRAGHHPGRIGDLLESRCDVLPRLPFRPIRVALAARHSALWPLLCGLIDRRGVLRGTRCERSTPVILRMTSDDVAGAPGAPGARFVSVIEHGGPRCA